MPIMISHATVLPDIKYSTVSLLHFYLLYALIENLMHYLINYKSYVTHKHIACNMLPPTLLLITEDQPVNLCVDVVHVAMVFSSKDI